MGYCTGRQWISPFTYMKLRTTLRSGAGLPPEQASWHTDTTLEPRQFTPDQDIEYLMMVGRLFTETQSVTMLPMMRLMGSDLDPEAEVNPAGSYSIRLLDAADNVLAEQSIGMLLGNHQEEGANLIALVPYMTETARIAVTQEAIEFFSYSVSPNPPQVALDPISGMVSGPITVTWSASDPDGDNITATLLFSEDGGATWDPIALGIPGDQVDLETDFWPGTDQGMLRILVTDGVNTSEDITGPFGVPSKAPEAFIVAPHDWAVLPPEMPVFFLAAGDDAEDGPLSSGAYSWTSDRDGYLGSGEEILVEALSPGWHQVTVTATDSHNNTASDTISVYVGYRMYLPLIFK
jgi:hypothetical protein